MTPRASDLPAPSSGFAARVRGAWHNAVGYVRQLLSPLDVAVSGSSSTSEPGYSQLGALSALAAFPWVRACVQAVCDDVGGVPLLAVRGSDGRDPLPGHEFLSLMQRPSPGVTETILRQQLVADLRLARNAYLWLRPMPGGRWELHRLHPEHCRPVKSNGVRVAWKYRDRTLTLLEVWHVRGISWQDDDSGEFGESVIRCLEPGLIAVREARKHAATQAAQGRPDIILTLPETAAIGPDAADRIQDRYSETMRLGRRLFVVGGGAKPEPVTWSPQELQFAELDLRVRDETCAVLGVPPSRAFTSEANFATAKVELRQYWQTLSTSDMKLFEDAFTAIARIVGGDPTVVIRHDLSSVEALQASYDQRQARAGFWVTTMGAKPDEAARFEGFRGAPVGEVAGGQNAKRPAVEVDDQPSRQRMPAARAAMRLYLANAAERMQGGGADRSAEVYRCAGALEIAGVPSAEAVELAESVVPVLVEIADHSDDRDLAESYAFSAANAERVVRQLREPLALAAK